MSFTRRLTFSFVAILLLSLGSVLVQVWGNDSRRRNVWLLQSVINTQAEMNAFSQQLYGLQRKMRVVEALNQSAANQQLSEDERNEILQALEQLRALQRQLSRDLKEFMRPEDFAPLRVDTLLDGWQRYVMATERGDGDAEALQAPRELAEYYLRISRQLSENELLLLIRSDEINAKLKDIVSLTNKVALAVFLLALIVTFVLGYYMTRYTRRSIRQLQKGTAEWGSGNFNYRIADMGHDEFGQLATSFNEMASNLRNAMARVREASRRADAATKAKSGFLANMSHELRTPMNAIIGYSEMLLEEIEDDPQLPAEQLQADLEKVQLAGKHLLTLINDVLDISKIESGRMAVFWETVELTSVLRDVEVTAQPLVAKNNNRLHCSYHVEETPLRTDVTRLRQVLLNLLSNAAKFTRGGDIRLKVWAEQEAPDELCFEVSDSGIGMSQEQLEKVFDAFVQADLSTTKQYGGSGLGLTISRKFAELLGGSLSAESREGEGSRFLLKLPVNGEQSSAMQAAVVGEELADVLVIDDDSNTQEIVRRHLQREGYGVRLASSGADGLAQARQQRPDLIVLDVMMPVMDGWQVLHALRSDVELSSVPVLMQSMLNERDLGLLLGANEYLVKPVERDELTAAVRELIPAGAAGNLMLLEQGGVLAKVIAKSPGAQYWRVYQAESVEQARSMLAERPWQLFVVGPHADEQGVGEFLSELRGGQWRSVPIMLARTEEDTSVLEQQLALYLRRAGQ
mgnify:FL=1